MKNHNGACEAGEVLFKRSFSKDKHNNYSICLVDTVSEFFGIDPTTTSLNLEEHLDLDAFNQAFTHHRDEESCTNIGFPYGGYGVVCCTCGEIIIYGNARRHERGEVELPDSMSSSTKTQIRQSLTENTDPQESRFAALD